MEMPHTRWEDKLRAFGRVLCRWMLGERRNGVRSCFGQQKIVKCILLCKNWEAQSVRGQLEWPLFRLFQVYCVADPFFSSFFPACPNRRSTLTNNQQTGSPADCPSALAAAVSIWCICGANASYNGALSRFNQIALVYNQLRPNHYHQFLKMEYCDDLWLLQPENDLFQAEDFDFQLPSPQQHALHQEKLFLQTNYLLSYHAHLQTTPSQPKQQHSCSDSVDEHCSPLSSPQNSSSANICLSSQCEPKAAKKSKPSPYHNYQKHLNQALKHLIVLPSPNAPSEALRVAHKLWGVFLASSSPAKKIFHFLFNEFNEYRIRPADLRVFGLEEIYAECPAQVLAEARTLLTSLAVEQMDEENIDSYLETRRIKSPLKFKKYMLLFRQELEEGFLKKRFTNLSRKEQFRRELMASSGGE